MRYKLVAFDMDGTLVLDNSCWRVIHRHFGTQDGAHENLTAYGRGEIDYREFMRRDIALWRPVPTVDEIRSILSGYEIAPNVRDVVKEIQRREYQTAIVTGGLDLMANDVAKELGIPNLFANGLEADESGRLTGEGVLVVEPSQKDSNLVQLANRLNVELEQCVAVGDGKYDAKFLKLAGLGVAIGKDLELARVADVVIEDFEHFPQLLDYL